MYGAASFSFFLQIIFVKEHIPYTAGLFSIIKSISREVAKEFLLTEGAIFMGNPEEIFSETSVFSFNYCFTQG